MVKNEVINIFFFCWRNNKVGLLLPKQLKGFQYSEFDVYYAILNLKKSIPSNTNFIIFSDIENILKSSILSEIAIVKNMWSDFQNLGACYKRLKLFEFCNQKYLNQKCLMLDLDILLGNLSLDFIHKYDMPMFLESYTPTGSIRIGGGLWVFRGGDFLNLYKEFKKNSDYWINLAKELSIGGSDQAILNMLARNYCKELTLIGEKEGIYLLSRVKKFQPKFNFSIVFSHGSHYQYSLRSFILHPWIFKHFIKQFIARFYFSLRLK